jgi:hypothetical protein
METFREPSRCQCGRKGAFKLLDTDCIDFFSITLMNENKDTFDIEFDEKFLKNEALKKGNIVAVIGVIEKEMIEDSTEVKFGLTPYGFSLIKEEPDIGTEEFLNAMQGKPFAFEEFIGDLFANKGYKTKVTKKTGDYGVDVIAEKGSERIAIQCKMLNKDNKISNTAIQKAKGSLDHYNANKLIFITTANEYTKQANAQANSSKIPIELWDRTRLIAEINANMKDLEEGWDKLAEIEEKQRQPQVKEMDIEKPFEIANISTEISASQKSRLILVREVISRLEQKFGKLIPLQEVKNELKDKIEPEIVEEMVEKLCFAGDLFKPKKEFIQRM